MRETHSMMGDMTKGRLRQYINACRHLGNRKRVAAQQTLIKGDKRSYTRDEGLSK